MINKIIDFKLKDKDMRKLVAALEIAGLETSITKGKHHIKVVNRKTNKTVFIGSQSLNRKRAGHNIARDLKLVGFDIKNINLG